MKMHFTTEVPLEFSIPDEKIEKLLGFSGTCISVPKTVKVMWNIELHHEVGGITGYTIEAIPQDIPVPFVCHRTDTGEDLEIDYVVAVSDPMVKSYSGMSLKTLVKASGDENGKLVLFFG